MSALRAGLTQLTANRQIIDAIEKGAAVQARSIVGGQIGGWRTMSPPSITLASLADPRLEWRLKPTTPREFFINRYANTAIGVYPTREKADAVAKSHRLECIHVREVLD